MIDYFAKEIHASVAMENRIRQLFSYADAAGKDMFFLTEGRQRLCDFDMVPKAQDVFSSGDFLIAVHSLSYTTEIYDWSR